MKITPLNSKPHHKIIICDKIELLAAVNEPSFQSDIDMDGDVDGLDLALHADSISAGNLPLLAAQFGD